MPFPTQSATFQVVGFKTAAALLIEFNQDRHDFAQSQALRSIAKMQPKAQKLLFPERFKALTEIDGAEQVF
ncbi:hypothetical protein [Leptolyngbya sp. FACHB-321]|uniref:hypothetical protein n=1 Tax=Leptolyngbya sp. FACHB-321 TaxID=2692807 RepID=UPI001684EFB5|nr:hypothetical protein [Leptolyngbya sp. FACHB-321]